MEKKITKNKSFLFVLLTLFLVLTFTQCQKAPINGKLDGMWEVKEISDGESSLIPRQRLFYNFYSHVCNLTTFGNPYLSGNMNYTGETLTLDFPNVNPSVITNLKLSDFGIYSNPVTFGVNFINNKTLDLKDGDITIRLIKF